MIKIGEIIEFGAYYWRVLDKTDCKILLLADSVLSSREYTKKSTDTTWEYSSIRCYLNDDFFNTFDDSQKNKILKTKVINNKNHYTNTTGGNDTEDKIFLLSNDEANKYFRDSSERRAFKDNKECWWWLRSPGGDNGFSTFVDLDGNISKGGGNVEINLGIRPAMWLKFL